MATSQMSEVVERLRHAALRRDGAGTTDAQLLEAFVTRRDAAALGALVRRHGPMVWGVCRRVLGNYHDAEDAFQATFLVLVRRAESVSPRELVGNWLYGVAYQTARKARSSSARRQARERLTMDMPEPETVAEAVAHELRPLLDQELSRLPDKYRAAIVLCDLEGTTHREAARQLGVPEGTLSGHLTRGRAMLAKRLVRHGLGVASVAAALSENCATAGVPAAVVSSTIRAVTLLAAGDAAAAVAVPAQVQALVKGVLQTMVMKKVQIATVLVLAMVLASAGVGLLAHAATTERPDTTLYAKSPPPEGGKSKPAPAPSLPLKEVTIDFINLETNRISVTVGKKAQVAGEVEFFLDLGNGQITKVKGKLDGVEIAQKLPRLIGLPVAPEARITSGDKTMKLADLKTGMHASLDLSERDGQLIVIAIDVKK